MKKSIAVGELIEWLLAGKSACKESIMVQYEIKERTFQRYIKELKEHFQENLIKIDKMCYRLKSVESLKGFLANHDIQNIVDLYTMINPNILTILDEDEKKLVNKLQDKNKEIYQVDQEPFELFNNQNILDAIKFAIKNRRYIDITYQLEHPIVFTMLKPFKIVFSQGNWYLATHDSNEELNGGFRWLRISFIKHVERHTKTYHKDTKLLQFINHFQTIFSLYDVPTYKVIVDVNLSVKRHFERKKFLQSQKIVRNDERHFQLSFEINNSMELLPLIKKWLPHLTIVEPNFLKEELKRQLEESLNKY
jgi:predicted DNA-binding transcriptional regulator YafY